MSKDQDYPIPPCFDRRRRGRQRLKEMFVEIAQAKRIRTIRRRRSGRCSASCTASPMAGSSGWPTCPRPGGSASSRMSGSMPGSATPATPRRPMPISAPPWACPSNCSACRARRRLASRATPPICSCRTGRSSSSTMRRRWSSSPMPASSSRTIRPISPTTRRPTTSSTRCRTASRAAASPRPIGRSCPSGWAARSSNIAGIPTPPPENVPDDATDYLATDLANRLAGQDYSFRLEVQLRTDPATMPLDEATVPWPEKESPWRAVARLTLPRQDVCARGQGDYGQSLAFNIWRVPEVNAPAPESSVAWVRKAVYAAGAELATGPTASRSRIRAEPRPVTSARAGARRLHRPGGDLSLDRHRPGRQQPRANIMWARRSPTPAAAGGLSIATPRAALKRQAARFRIYGVNAAARSSRELTGRRREDRAGRSSSPTPRPPGTSSSSRSTSPRRRRRRRPLLRNADRRRPRRSSRSTPARARVGGANARAAERFDDRQLHGHARSISARSAPTRTAACSCSAAAATPPRYDGSRAITFANNDGWHDDVSDGPVDADGALGGRRSRSIPAWVVVAPPELRAACASRSARCGI